MRRTLALALLFAIVQRCVSAVNYCGAKMCGYTNAHTFCQYPAGPSPSCSGYVEAPLTLEEKVRILTRLNRRRSDVATGRLRNYPTAGDMLKLRWVEELAREAQRWADQCRPPNTPDEHDACRDLYSVSVGQNVASVVGEAPGLRVESMVDMWYMQSIHYKGNVTNYEPPMSTVNYYGDFAQIVWSYTYMVGCGRSRFMIHLNGRMRSVERLVCNFAPRGPMSGQSIWSLDEPASLCPVRSLPDSEFPGLCAYQPYIDVPNDLNNITTIEEITLLNTIFEIEINDELNYPGSMDEVYLTKIAIATLEDKAKTEAYNNNQKRDIYFLNTNMISNEFNNNVKEPDKEHLVQIKETSSQKPVQTKAKVKLIGRHKSYKTDDLIDVGGVQTTEHYPIPADIPQQKNEFYVDYQYVETNEGKSISTENIVVVSEISPITPHNTTENVMITSEVSNPLATMNVTFGYVEDINETSLKIDESMRNYNISYVTQKEEELFSDPEVVRDLELALRQMEQNMETSTITTASLGAEKVKRELREVSKDTMDRKPRDYGNISPILQEINMTADKAPMLNMILKYMPYLKPYKNELLGKVTNGAKIVLPPLIVRFIVFICMFIVIYGL